MRIDSYEYLRVSNTPYLSIVALFKSKIMTSIQVNFGILGGVILNMV